MRKWRVLLICSMAMFVFACSASDKKYTDHMDAALEQIEKDELIKAQMYVEEALAEKPDDPTAMTYYEQISELLKAMDEMDAGNIDAAKQHATQVIEAENGLHALVMRAENVQKEIAHLEATFKEYKEDLDEANNYLNNNQLNEVNEIIERMTANDLSHNFYKSLHDELIDLKIDVKIAEEKEAARIQAEEQKAKEEAERIARAKEEEAKTKKVFEKFKGYWLQDTMACHFADTYIACALARSDFMTHSEIDKMTYISDTEIEFTFKEGGKSTFRLLDDYHLELADGVYERVSEEEANAIYEGYYTLP